MASTSEQTYRESLPRDCPPAASEEIIAERNVFRLVRTEPPTDDDFRSQRAEHPQRVFRVSECRARAFPCTRNVATRRRRYGCPRSVDASFVACGSGRRRAGSSRPARIASHLVAAGRLRHPRLLRHVSLAHEDRHARFNAVLLRRPAGLRGAGRRRYPYIG